MSDTAALASSSAGEKIVVSVVSPPEKIEGTKLDSSPSLIVNSIGVTELVESLPKGAEGHIGDQLKWGWFAFTLLQWGSAIVLLIGADQYINDIGIPTPENLAMMVIGGILFGVFYAASIVVAFRSHWHRLLTMPLSPQQAGKILGNLQAAPLITITIECSHPEKFTDSDGDKHNKTVVSYKETKRVAFPHHRISVPSDLTHGSLDIAAIQTIVQFANKEDLAFFEQTKEELISSNRDRGSQFSVGVDIHSPPPITVLIINKDIHPFLVNLFWYWFFTLTSFGWFFHLFLEVTTYHLQAPIIKTVSARPLPS